MRTLLSVPSITAPAHPFARLLLLASTSIIVVFLTMAAGFICREIMLEIFVPDEIDGALLPAGHVMAMWKMGIRYDLQMGTWFALPIIFYAAFTFMFTSLWTWVNRGLTAVVFGVFLIMVGAMIVNFHFMITTEHPIDQATLDAFFANPDWSYLWDHYSVLYSGFFAILFAGTLTGLWKRFAYILSNRDMWHRFTIWHALGVPFLLLYLFLMFGQSGLASDRLTVEESRVSTVESINKIVMSAPSILYYDRQIQR